MASANNEFLAVQYYCQKMLVTCIQNAENTINWVLCFSEWLINSQFNGQYAKLDFTFLTTNAVNTINHENFTMGHHKLIIFNVKKVSYWFKEHEKEYC